MREIFKTLCFSVLISVLITVVVVPSYLIADYIY